MVFLYKQELFKLIKRRSTFWCLLFLVIQNCGIAVLTNTNAKYIDAKEMFADDYSSVSFITFVMIAASATIIATEFEYNTIKNIFYQQYSRKQVLISKWLTILTYSLFAYVVLMIVSLLNKFILFGNDFNLTDKMPRSSMTIWQCWFSTNFANFLTM